MINEPTCCCMSIRTVAKEIGILGIVFTVIIIILAFYNYSCISTGNFWFLLWVIYFLPNYAIIYAVKKDKSWAYLPYLILNGIGSFYIAKMILVILIHLTTDIRFISDYDNNDDFILYTIDHSILSEIIALAICILHIYFYVVIYRAYNFTKYVIEPSRKSLGQEQINNTTSTTQSIQHPEFINGNTDCPSYNAYAYPGQGHLYPQQIDIPIGFVNSYAECLEPPPCYQLHDPATNQPTHSAPNAQEDMVAP